MDPSELIKKTKQDHNRTVFFSRFNPARTVFLSHNKSARTTVFLSHNKSRHRNRIRRDLI